MKLSTLKDLILIACDNGYADVDVDVVQSNSTVDDGCPMLGLRCVTDSVDGSEIRYVSIIEG